MNMTKVGHCFVISFFSLFLFPLQESHMDLLIWCMVLTNMKARQNIFLLLALNYLKCWDRAAHFQLADLIFELIFLKIYFQITSTAGGGTLTLEFGVLSRLTNDPGQWSSWALVFHVLTQISLSRCKDVFLYSLFCVFSCSYLVFNFVIMKFSNKLQRMRWGDYGHVVQVSTWLVLTSMSLQVNGHKR